MLVRPYHTGSILALSRKERREIGVASRHPKGVSPEAELASVLARQQ